MSTTYIIYETLCLANLKIYVGQHNTSADDGYLGSGIILENAIKKYSKEKFQRTTIEFCTSADVNEKEIYWIDKLSANNPEIGYNIAKGGNGGYIVEWTDEMKRKLSNERKEKYIGKNNPNYGNKWTKEQKQKASNRMVGKPSWCKGLTKLDDRIRKITEKRKNTISKIPNFQKKKNHPRYKNLNDIEIIKMYNRGMSINKIAKIFNVNNSIISRHLKYNEVKIRKNGLKKDDINKLIEMYNRGISINKIAKTFSINEQSIYSILKRNNVIINRKNKITEYIIKQINNLYKNGHSIIEISKICNVSYSTVYRQIGRK